MNNYTCKKCGNKMSNEYTTGNGIYVRFCLNGCNLKQNEHGGENNGLVKNR